MDLVLDIVRMLALAAMVAAVVVSGTELKRLYRNQARKSVKASMWAVFVVSLLGMGLRILTNVNAFITIVNPVVLIFVANTFFIVLGVSLVFMATGTYRRELQSATADAVVREVEKRISGD